MDVVEVAKPAETILIKAESKVEESSIAQCAEGKRQETQDQEPPEKETQDEDSKEDDKHENDVNDENGEIDDDFDEFPEEKVFELKTKYIIKENAFSNNPSVSLIIYMIGMWYRFS